VSVTRLLLNRGQVRTIIRDVAVDADTVKPVLSDTQWNDLLEDVYSRYWSRFAPALSSLSTSLSFGGALSAPLTAFSLFSSPFQRLDRLYLETGAQAYPTSASTELEKLAAHEILWLQKNRPSTDSPKYFSIERFDNVPGSMQSPWAARFYPVSAAPSTHYFTAAILLQSPADITTDSDILDLSSNEEVRIVARVTAAIGASRSGRPQDFIENIWRTIPEDVQEVFRTIERPEKVPN